MISGKVVDGTNLEPLPASHVHSPDNATITNSEGVFQLEVDTLPFLLVISHVGYMTDTIKVTEPNTSIVIPLAITSNNLHEVIVSASHRNVSVKNTPASIGLITKETMRRDDQTMITPALNRIPGVYMHSGTMSTNRITIRGIGARTPYGTNKIRAYFDHIPLTSGVGETTLEDIDMSLFERVEVVKGPNSSIYGSGLGGVINIKPAMAGFNTTSLSSSGMYGSYNTYHLVNRFSHSNYGNHINVVHSLLKSDGYRENSNYFRESLGLTGRFSTSEHSHLSVIGTYTYLKSHIPSALDEETYQINPQNAAYTWNAAQGFEEYDKAMLGISYQQQIAPDWFSNSSVFINYRDAFEPRPFNILRENTIGSGMRQTIRFNSAPFSVYAGIEMFRDQYQWSTFENRYQEVPGQGSVLGVQISDNKQIREYYNVYFQANMDINHNISIVAGANFNKSKYRLADYYNRDTINQAGDNSFEPAFSPRIGLVFHSSDNIHFYTNLSHGFSPPGLEESLRSDGTINVDIQPEKGWNMEIGGRGGLLNDQLDFDASLYYMIINDLLVAQRDSFDAYVGSNAGETRHLGIEFVVNYHHSISNNYTLNYYLNGSVMHYRFHEFIERGIDHSGNELTGVPSEIFHAGIDLRSTEGFYGSLNSEYVGQIPLNDANELFSDNYFVLRSKLGYIFQLAGFEFDVYGGIQNITDTKYASMLQINAVGFGGSNPRYYYPGEPRNYYGGLKIAYTF
ncbi:MAG: TonB-dependent receptor [Bacteroidetes bacterium]|nr:TonB-dependent receptor [Bacteroidota bacterium]